MNLADINCDSRNYIIETEIDSKGNGQEIKKWVQ